MKGCGHKRLRFGCDGCRAKVQTATGGERWTCPNCGKRWGLRRFVCGAYRRGTLRTISGCGYDRRSGAITTLATPEIVAEPKP